MLFNRLEFWNESALILLAYVSIGFSGVVGGQSTGLILAEVLAFIVTVGIVLANFYVLFYKTWLKIKSWNEKRLQKKIQKARLMAKDN